MEDDDKYEPEEGLRSGFWVGLFTWTFFISLAVGFASYCTGCSSYRSSRTMPYGAETRSSREVYGPVRIGSDTTSAGEHALDRLAECVRDREAQATRVTEAQQRQMDSFGQRFWILMPPSWGNPSSLTDDHLLCLMLVSGADPGYAVSIARSRWQPGPVLGGYGGYGYGGYGSYYAPMGTVGAPGVR